MKTANSKLTDKQLNTYFREVKHKLYGGDKHKFIQDLKNNIHDYLEDHPDATYPMLTEHFGAPEDIAKAFCVENNVDYIKRERFNRTVKIILITAILAGVLFIGVLTAMIMKHYSDNTMYYYTESVYYTSRPESH